LPGSYRGADISGRAGRWQARAVRVQARAGLREQCASRRGQAHAVASRAAQSASMGDQLFERGVDSAGPERGPHQSASTNTNGRNRSSNPFRAPKSPLNSPGRQKKLRTKSPIPSKTGLNLSLLAPCRVDFPRSRLLAQTPPCSRRRDQPCSRLPSLVVEAGRGRRRENMSEAKNIRQKPFSEALHSWSGIRT
jgi:hypothetical protein